MAAPVAAVEPPSSTRFFSRSRPDARDHFTYPCVETARNGWSLRQNLGFRAEATPDELGDDAFAAASLLNVLDRCDEPGALLNLVADRVADGGLVLIASVLPYSPMVHEGRFLSPYGKAQSRRAKRPLQVKAAQASLTNAAIATFFDEEVFSLSNLVTGLT